ncbi:hypothetical protein TUM4641_33070 [Shewanella morhuae]|nr:hypothetical protein TUM4641_33070 [Shewanella morhuae]
MSSKDTVFQQVKYFRNKEAAKFVLSEQKQAVVIIDQCLTEHIGHRFVLFFKSIFRTQHKFEVGALDEVSRHRRMHRLRRSIIDWLERGTKVPASRYTGRYRYILKYEVG